MIERPWYLVDNPEQLDTPALLIYPDRVKQNINLLLSMIDDPGRLRPHAKTHKNPEVTALLLEAGITRFKCATIAEAEMLAAAGAIDILIAYQLVSVKLNRLLWLIESFPATTFSCLVDNSKAAAAMSGLFSQHGVEVNVYLDLNPGMNRTGISPGQDAVDLYIYCAGLVGIKPIGLHWYDGHINNADLAVRTYRCNQAYAGLQQTQDALQAAGYNNTQVIAGGSTTFPIHSKRENVQCSPGTFVYWDEGYLNSCSEQPFQPAALVITRVISKPTPTTICLDLGHKSVASENELTRRVSFLNAEGLKPVSQSEEHLVADTSGSQYEIGDLIYGLPYHICPTCALYERATIIEHKQVAGEWKIPARDRKLNI